jgi:hypothetical protein
VTHLSNRRCSYGAIGAVCLPTLFAFALTFGAQGCSGGNDSNDSTKGEEGGTAGQNNAGGGDAGGERGGKAGSASNGGTSQAASGGAGGSAAGTGGTVAASGGMAGGMTASGGAAGGMAGSAPVAGAGGKPAVVYEKPAFTADFENGVTGSKPPAPFSGGRGVVDETKSFSGKKSIKVVCPSGVGIDACPFTLPVANYIAANKKTGYARFMVYMNNLPKGGSGEHWDLVKFIGAFKGENGKQLDEGSFVTFGGFTNDQHKMHMFGFSGGQIAQDCVKRAGLVIKPGQWSCVEMKVDENDVLNYSASVDATPIQALTFPYFSAASACVPGWDVFAGVWYMPTISKMSFGFNRVNEPANDPVTVWIDDIAISKSPIGCPAPKP